jgi:hypothetical protein
MLALAQVRQLLQSSRVSPIELVEACHDRIQGGGKVGILLLDFHFSTAHSFSSSFCVTTKKQQAFFLELLRARPGGARARRGPLLAGETVFKVSAW